MLGVTAVDVVIIIMQPVCGLPIFHYFSAVKIVWLMENCSAVKEAIAAGNCLFGTVDTWLIWVCSMNLRMCSQCVMYALREALDLSQ